MPLDLLNCDSLAGIALAEAADCGAVAPMLDAFICPLITPPLPLAYDPGLVGLAPLAEGPAIPSRPIFAPRSDGNGSDVPV